MISQYVCRETPECNGHISKTPNCEKCGKPCQEELTTGEIVLRENIPEYILRDISNIETENTKLLNEFLFNCERFLMTLVGLQKNLDRRIQLQNILKGKIENGLRKLRLHRDTETRWGYDPIRKTFAGLRKPKSKVVEDGKS